MFRASPGRVPARGHADRPRPASAVIEAGYRALSPTWDAAAERTNLRLLIEILKHRGGVELDAQRSCRRWRSTRRFARVRVYEISAYDPDYPGTITATWWGTAPRASSRH